MIFKLVPYFSSLCSFNLFREGCQIQYYSFPEARLYNICFLSKNEFTLFHTFLESLNTQCRLSNHLVHNMTYEEFKSPPSVTLAALANWVEGACISFASLLSTLPHRVHCTRAFVHISSREIISCLELICMSSVPSAECNEIRVQ